MKKKLLIISTAVVLLSCLVILAGCNFLGAFYTDRTPYYIDVAEVEDPNAANIVANNNLLSCTRIIASFSNGKTSAGSGFVVTSDGYVVTNRHCVLMYSSTGSDTPYNPLETPLNATYKVVFADNKALSADLVGYSNDADLALLKIRNYADFTGSASFEPVKLSSSSDLFYGDKVYTIGNPEDLGLILTELMVSSPAIKVSSDDSFSSIILDGTINHGNSGGALFDKYGNVVGVVYARIEGSNSDAYGIGCAIPLDTLKEFLDEARVKYTVAADQSTE